MRTTAAASKRVFPAGQKKVVSSDLGLTHGLGAPVFSFRLLAYKWL
jgi:hypothetical protein